MENFIIILILVCIVGGIIYYLYKAKKRGDKCIGCSCSKQCGGNCSCGSNDKKNQTEKH